MSLLGLGENVTLWIWNVPCRLLLLNTWFSVNDTFWEVLETLGGGSYLDEVDHWGSEFEDCTWSPVTSLFSASCLAQGELDILFLYLFCFTMGLEAMQSTIMGWNLWHHELKEVFPPFKLFLLGILSQLHKSNIAMQNSSRISIPSWILSHSPLYKAIAYHFSLCEMGPFGSSVKPVDPFHNACKPWKSNVCTCERKYTDPQSY
jgi:hypothetical protein